MCGSLSEAAFRCSMVCAGECGNVCTFVAVRSCTVAKRIGLEEIYRELIELWEISNIVQQNRIISKMAHRSFEILNLIPSSFILEILTEPHNLNSELTWLGSTSNYAFFGLRI